MCNIINGHEYVDLGLSVVWATCNVGAEEPEEFGDYFAWGEIEPAPFNAFTEENCRSWDVKAGEISGDKRYDAARVKWGGTWRMPKVLELCDLRNKCEWEWTTINNTHGYRVKGKNGNSIFLPAAGYWNYTSLNSADESGDYWSSSPWNVHSYDNLSSYALSFVDSYIRANDMRNRCCGLSIRPVSV